MLIMVPPAKHSSKVRKDPPPKILRSGTNSGKPSANRSFFRSRTRLPVIPEIVISTTPFLILCSSTSGALARKRRLNAFRALPRSSRFSILLALSRSRLHCPCRPGTGFRRRARKPPPADARPRSKAGSSPSWNPVFCPQVHSGKRSLLKITIIAELP